ncbi:MAG: PQQ-binding-like beta-propeller repeat protein [Gaiellaceae bacterium]
MKRLLALLLLLALAGAVGAGIWVARHDRPHVVRGSATVEFNSRDAPEARRLRPKKVVLSEPWKTYGFDLQRTHFAADFKHRPPFRKVWTVRTGSYIEFPPTVAYGRVYVAQLLGRFFAIDAKTGRVIWKKRFLNCTAASPTVADGVLYQPYLPKPCNYGDRGRRGFIVAMSIRGGRQLWRFPVTSESSLLLVKNVLYFGSWDHNIYALDARTHKVRWRYRADDEVNSSAAYSSGMIFIGSNGGTLYALDARTGRLRWRARSFSSLRFGREFFYATPTVAYGRVYAANSDGLVYAFGARSGRLLWAQRAGPYVYSAPAVWRRTVYVGSYDGKLYALDAATGDVRWTFQSPSAIHGAPTVMGGLVYFSSCGTCGRRNSRSTKQGRRGTFAVDARTGKLGWKYPDGRYSPIVADGERVYLTGHTRQHAFEPRKPRTLAQARRPRSQ